MMMLCLNAQSVFGDQADVVRSLIIKGNQTFSKEQIRNLMQTSVGKPYDAEMLKKDSEKITRFLRNKGITYARVTESPKKFEDGIYIGVEIDEGKIGTITLSGNTKTRDNVILRELLFEKGDVYIEADKKESERILRQKRYIGAAKIEPKWDAELESVTIHVTVTELFSITGALDPGINNQSGYFLAQVREANIFGSGQAGQIRYERISEIGEKTRGIFTFKYRMPRLVDSHWNLDSEYVQEREGDSWRVLLERPQYTLKSRWSTNFSVSESINHVRWYENGKETDTFERTRHRTTGNILRYFGDRHHQNYIGLWVNSHRTSYLSIESIAKSDAAPLNRNIKRVGVTLGRKNVGFHQTRFLKGMGGDEDFLSGSQFNTTFGYASPLFGSERTEYYASLGLNGGWVSQNRFFGTALIEFATSFTNQIERSVLQARSALFYRDVFNTGDIYRVDTGFRENGLFDFQQTFVAQFKTEMQFGWRGESQVVLGAVNGLRGYGLRQFNGEKMMVLSIESRTLCGGDFFRKINDGLTKVATFFAKPFIKDRIVDLGLVLSVTAFTDIGYIWDSYRTFDIKEVKPSVGFGLRSSVSQVSDAGIFRIELAFPLDSPSDTSPQPQLFIGVERAF
jgi:outer membrane protein assembly factor BamA